MPSKPLRPPIPMTSDVAAPHDAAADHLAITDGNSVQRGECKLASELEPSRVSVNPYFGTEPE